MKEKTSSKANLNTKIFVSICSALCAVLVLTLLALYFSARNTMSDKIRSELSETRLTFDNFMSERFQTIKLNLRLIAESPRLKSVIVTPGIDRETVLFTLKEMQEVVNYDVFAVIDSKGIVTTRAHDPGYYGDDLSGEKGVRLALEGKEYAALEIVGGKLYQVISMPITSDGAVYGVLWAGYRMDDAFAKKFHNMAESHIAFSFNKTLLASSGSRSEAEGFQELLNQQDSLSSMAAPQEFSLAGEKQLAIVSPFKGDFNDNGIMYILMISLNRSLAIYYRSLQLTLILIGFIAALISFVVSFLTARSISSPIRQLAICANEVARGNLDQNLEVRSNDEIGELTESFNRMIKDLRNANTVLAGYSKGLESEVRQRTEELDNTNHKLQDWVAQLERRNLEASLLSELDDVLQTCTSKEEIHRAVISITQRLFPEWSGFIAAIGPTGNTVEVAATWGNPPSEKDVFSPDDCVALRRAGIHVVDDASKAVINCQHLRGEVLPPGYICVSLTALSGNMGILSLFPPKKEDIHIENQHLIGTIAKHTSLALSNVKLRGRLEIESVRDPLTGLFNRRYMEESMEIEISRAKRQNIMVGVIMIDIDLFKKFNDSEGHEAGDVVLVEVARYLQMKCRHGDIICRYGGEEFVVILPQATNENTRQKAEELRVGVKALQIKYGDKILRPVSFSVGVGLYPINGATGKEVLQTADSSLYTAKQGGRDRIVAAF